LTLPPPRQYSHAEILPAAAGAKRLAESKFQGKHRQPYEPWDD